MDYTEAQAAFFAPRPDAGAGPGWSTPARRLREALEPLATVSYWSRAAYDAHQAHGLDFLTGYVWSRACVLGEPDGSVVAAAFGVFEPAAVAGLYDAARERCTLAQIRELRESGAVRALGAALGGTSGLPEVTEVLRRGAQAADTAGRPLFAGLRGLAWPTDPYAALWHAATLLRECRGDSHVAACVAAGLSGVEANVLTELWVGFDPLAYTATRAWPPEVMDAAVEGLRRRGLLDGSALSEQGRQVREQVEQATDLAVQPVLDAIGADLAVVVERATAWGEQVIAAGSFPPDPYKRLAG